MYHFQYGNLLTSKARHRNLDTEAIAGPEHLLLWYSTYDETGSPTCDVTAATGNKSICTPQQQGAHISSVCD